jgi:SulP family sulfate permease
MFQGPATQTLVRMLRQPFEDARGYNLESLRRDGLAGLTVAVVAVPQSLAYAVVAGVPPEVGLHTLIVQSVIGSLLCSQRFLSSGPINTQSLLVAAITTRVLQSTGVAPGPEATALYLELVVFLSLFKGALQMALAAGGLATLVRYVSGSVILGFTGGAGILIAASQLAPFLGIDPVLEPAKAAGLAGTLSALASHVGDIRGASIGVGLASLAIVIGMRRFSRLLPGPLVAVVIGAAAVALLGWSAEELPLVGPLPRGLPSLRIPALPLAHVEALFGGALALAVVGLMEAWSIGKTIAARTGQRLSAGQELFAQGFTNAASAFFGCIPGSGSFSRSALTYRAGAATRYVGVFNAFFAAALLLGFAPLAAWVPKASLSAVLFVIAWELVDWRGIGRVVRTSRSDASVCLVTFVATITIPLAYAVFVGVVLNIGLYLRRVSRLHLAEMVAHPDDPDSGRFFEQPLRDAAPSQPVVFLQLQGDLFFGQADELADRLADLHARGVEVVVIRLKRTLSVDSTILATLEQFVLTLRRAGGHVILCGVQPDVTRRLRAYGIIDLIGEDCFFEATPGVFESAQRALARARTLTRQDVDPGDWGRDPDEDLTRDS